MAHLVRQRMSVHAALTIERERLAQRDANFLRVIACSVFGNPRSRYRALLDAVGCRQQDLGELVSTLGLEGALLHLRRAGVYVSFEEFKRIQPIVRVSITLDATPSDFDNPTTGTRRS